MTAKPIALAKARAAKQRALDRLAELEMMNNSYLMILGVLLDHVEGKCVTIDVAVLEAFDTRRVAIADMSNKHGKIVIGLKKDADTPLEITGLKARALKAVEAPPADESDERPVAQPVEQAALTRPVGGSNPSGLAEPANDNEVRDAAEETS